MAQNAYRANLSVSNFPFYSALHGQSVIMGQLTQDQYYIAEPQANNNADKEKDRGIPQMYYCENVMPTGYGYQSIGFNTKIPGIAGVTVFDRVYTLRDVNENFAYFVPANGNNYIFDGNVGAWASVSPIVANDAICTVAYLSGETYIFYEKIGCYKYNFTTKLLEPVTLLGLDASLIKGILSAQSFLIVYDDFTVYRSSLVNPLDFVPDYTVGSGSERVQDVESRINFVLPIPGGYIVYTKNNAVSASFNVNQRQPFVYNSIKNSGGVQHLQHVSYRDNSGSHYAWTSVGLQQLNKSSSSHVFPELTDFLIAKIYEEFNQTTWAFTTEKLSAQLEVAVTVVGSRYLVVSYGKTKPYQYALVHDMAFGRWGKIKIEHSDVFEFVQPSSTGETPYFLVYSYTYDEFKDLSYAELLREFDAGTQAKDIIGFLQTNGAVVTADFSLTTAGDTGLIVCGKYQHRRTVHVAIDEIEVENAQDTGGNLVAKILSTLNGKTVYNISTPFPDPKYTGEYRRFFCKANGRNHTVVFAGTFSMNTFLLRYHMEGRV